MPQQHHICAVPVDKGFFLKPLTDPLQWRDDEQALYFRICAPRPTPPQLGLASNLSVWHWRDDELPARRKAEAGNAPPAFLSLLWIADSRFVPLASVDLPEVAPRPRGRYVLGFDARGLGWRNDRLSIGWRGTQLRDYSVVDVRTGKRTVIVRQLPVMPTENGPIDTQWLEPQLSPDGRFVFYRNEGDLLSVEIATGKVRNLTADLPAKFINGSLDFRGRQQLKQSETAAPLLQGWTRDGSAALVSDYYDLWLLPMDGASPRNLTRNGRQARIAYSLYFKAVELDTRRTGLARLGPRKETLDLLRWDDADVDYFRARAGDVRLFRRMSATASPDYYVADRGWHSERRLTDINPRQREIHWFPNPRFLTYQTAGGETLHASLYLPIGYVPGRSYPTIVELYEYQSGGLHNYVDRISGTSGVSPWLERGYAVLWPDVVPRVGEPGPAAAEATDAAVDAAVVTGIVDGARLGLFGHSFGGYEASFVVTRSDRFKAAVVYAGMSDLASDYGAVYYERWPKSQLYELGQGSLGVPLLENADLYRLNSPLYQARTMHTPLLLVHGDQDGAVAFSQAVELFNVLRRLGDKPVVLLQYGGEDHDFGASSADFELRMREFFGHFLKEEPAPRWWTDGISYYAGETAR